MTSRVRSRWPLGLGAAALVSAIPAAAQQPYPSAPPTYPPSAPPEGTPLTTGGLTPPPAAESRPGEAETLQRLELAEREDSGRGLEFVWLEAETGYEYLALQSFHDNELLDGEAIAGAGSALTLGAGAGVRLVFLTVGGRFRLASSEDWDLWTLNAEVGLHVPIGALEPSFTFSAGYASLGAFSAEGAGGLPNDIDVSGFDARLGAAVDWYVNPLLSLGLRSSFEVLALYRSAPQAPAPATDAELARVYGQDGSGVGLGVTALGVVGLHF